MMFMDIYIYICVMDGMDGCLGVITVKCERGS